MMDELKELYQEVILDHNRNPKNFGALADHSHDSEGNNPLCGDRVHVYLKVEDERIVAVSFEGSGCAISKASASMMTEMLKGKTIAEARKLFNAVQAMITADASDPINMDGLGKMAVLAGVREFPSRVKCAGLSWHAMLAALDNADRAASTE